MKYFLLLVTLFAATSAIAQHNIVIKVQKQSLTVNLGDDNSEKSIAISSKSKTGKADKLIIYNTNKTEAKTWKRSFTIYNEADSEIIKFPTATKASYYQLPLSAVLSKLKKDTSYLLYTVAIPADPKRAAVVRVRRVLICKIEVK